MTPKEKAEELINRFLWNMPNPNTTNAAVAIIAKQCALIAVDEILKSNPTRIDCDSSELNYGYWQQVKKEIENL